MNKFEGVANTLFVPLVARINISKKFPEYFYDEKALELEQYLPEDADKCDMQLLEEKSFFPDALQMLGKKLGFVTKVSMKVAEKKKQVKILRLKLN